jgi:hypothetical protein
MEKILCQPTIHADPSGKLIRRILSTTSTDPPQMTRRRSATLTPTTTSVVELTHTPPTAYNIYVDGGWDTENADFNTAFREQRDPTNRRGSAGIAIVPTGPGWMSKGTILNSQLS